MSSLFIRADSIITIYDQLNVTPVRNAYSLTSLFKALFRQRNVRYSTANSGDITTIPAYIRAEVLSFANLHQ